MATPAMTAPRCSVCGADARYTCPGCAARTCSVGCVRAHRRGPPVCTGRARAGAEVTGYVPRGRLGAVDAADSAFLERCRSVLGGCASGSGDGGDAKANSARLAELREAARKRGVFLERLPEGMARARRNASYVDSAGSIYWTVELIHSGKDARTYATVHEEARLCDVLPPGAHSVSLLPRGVSSAVHAVGDTSMAIRALLHGATVLEFPSVSYSLD